MIRGVLLRFFLGRLIAGVCVMGVLGQLPWLLPKEADATQPFVLDPESFRHYVDRFNDEDEELVTHDESQLIDLLDDLVDNYGGWEEARLTESGLFWQIDDRDGMEVSVGGSGKRATINSYMYGDATAIARIAELAGREQLAEQFRQKAATLKHLVQTQLWDDEAQFFKTLPRSPYELTTFAWVATTKSVPSMTEKVLPRRRTLSTSGSSMVTHRNIFTGDWIARTHCEQRNAELKARGEENRILRERGKDYNHSSYCDLIITGLVGLRPREDDIIEVNPLVPADRWDWFCLDNVPYHGKTLTILWDKTGDRYGMGQGFRVFVDGKQIAQHDKLGHIQQ